MQSRLGPLTIDIPGPQPELPQSVYDDLRASIRGSIFRPSDPEFAERTRTFNGKISPRCRAAACPLDAGDVSALVRFCAARGLTLSVKAGGYATAGWAVAGDVLVDLALMRECSIECPLEPDPVTGKDWVAMDEGRGKGKRRVGEVGSFAVRAADPGRDEGQDSRDLEPGAGAKRRRDDDGGSTLGGENSTTEDGDGVKRRRGDDEDGTGAGGNAATDDDDALPVLRSTQEKRNLLGSYDGASASTATFLRGPPLPIEVGGEEPRKLPEHQSRRTASEDEVDGSQTPAGAGNAAVSKSDAPSEAQVAHSGMDEDADRPSSAQVHEGATEADRHDAGSGAPHAHRNSEVYAPAMAERSDSGASMLSASTWSSVPQANTAATTPISPGSAVSTTFPAFTSVPLSFPSSVPLSFPAHAGATMPAFGPGAAVAGMPPFALNPSGGAGMAFAPMGAAPGMPPFPFPSAGLFGGPLPLTSGVLGSPFAPPPSGVGMTLAPARPVHAHAYVTLGAGMRQKEVDMYTAAHALEGVSSVGGARQEGAVPYHIPSSAHPVGSSILVLGGFGFLSRLHGLSIDNLVEVEMVLADGRIVVVNKESDPDLWWAVRGAGPAFGIATRYKVRAFPVPVVFAGNLVYRFHRATAPSLIKHFRDCIKGAPRELYANVLLTAGPAGADSLVVIQMCYIGPRERGIEYLNAISSWDGERCLLNEVNEKSFLAQQDSVAQILRGKAGRQWFIRSALIHSLPDEVVNKTVIQFANTPIGCTWIFELSGGAIADFEDTCLPKEQREAVWTVAALHQWDLDINDPRCITSAEEWIDGTIGSVALGGPFPSFLGRHEPPARTMECYGKNWARLAELKRRYDPECLFKNNFWPLDKDGQPIELLSNEPPSPYLPSPTK
ncbi:hypothetical protein WOLCODRAFT_140014 [Wolfiporia cocos MD-104 SS10]|uniref:FAD-binding PCMH-type domain-containing protein n=1 Tax=Wolfiporia cocos (strain MD-104) TaxID=742152 RepID=A0A2H3JI26_WOLCO|nr:hypothetical protein WOLCODRAFT_140014 [Wolfiporia cocos MD-104 SS10]